MLNIESIAVDPVRAFSGVWMEYMGGRFLVARKGSPEYDARLVELFNEHRDLIRSDTAEGNEKAIDIYRQVFAEKVLLDWDQIVDANKNPIPYTVELGLSILRNPLQFELTTALERFSMMHSNYRAVVEQEIAEEVKDSAAS